MKCPTSLRKYKPNNITNPHQTYTIESQKQSKKQKGDTPQHRHNNREVNQYQNKTPSYHSNTYQDNCSMEGNCPNLVLIQKLQKHISEIAKENVNLKQINDYFLKQFSKNSNIFRYENNCLPSLTEHTPLEKPKLNLFQVVQSAIEKQEIKELKKPSKSNEIIPCNDKKNTNHLKIILQNKAELKKQNEQMSFHQKQGKEVSLLKIDESKPYLPKKKFDYFQFLTKPKQKSANDHYDYLNNLVKHKNVKLNQLDSRVSFLACDIPYLRNLITCDTFKQMKKIAQNKSVFASSICSLSSSKLENVCDYITGIIADYDQGMNLIIRLKVLLNILFSRHHIESLSISMNYLLASGRSALECQKVFIYLYDPLIDSLVIYHEEHEKVMQRNFDKTKDIIGYTFTKIKLQKIDDLSYDARFDKENDRDLCFYSKSMLCSPLLDEEGKCLGVLQAINKIHHNSKDIMFSVDDEELMMLYTRYCEEIIQSTLQYERKVTYTNQMKLLMKYSLDIKHCDTIPKLLSLSCKVLGELWSVKIAQVVLVNHCKGKNIDKERINEGFVSYDENDTKCDKPFTGLLRKCYEMKNNVICASSFDDKSYNHSVDIECCFSIITFPIYESNYGEMIAIGQVGTTLKFSKLTANYLHPNEVTIIAMFSRIISSAFEDKEK